MNLIILITEKPLSLALNEISLDIVDSRLTHRLLLIILQLIE